MDNQNNIIRDLGIVILSILVAVILAKTGVLNEILTATQELKFLGSFLAGMFFVSIFTAAPAMVVLVGIIQSNSILEVAIFGGLGGLVGDLLIFRFVKDSIARDIQWLINKTKQERLASIFKLKLFRWLIPCIGALIVASPLPDEIGLTMMGLSKMKTHLFIPVSFLLNFIGIFILSSIARGLF